MPFDPPNVHAKAPGPYAANRMFGAPSAFARPAGFLRDIRPRVLVLSGNIGMRVPLSRPFSGPPSLREQAKPRAMGMFNPSLALAPAGLCPRCKYLVTLRVDALHQCDDSSPLYRSPGRGPIASGSWFKGTALMVLDEKAGVLAWSWLLPRPLEQVSALGNTSRWYVRPGVSGGFDPPWTKPIYDTRLLNYDRKRLFATFNCNSCTFSLAQVHVQGDVTPDGGIDSLRVWSPRRYVSWEAWAQGRNQALFVAELDDRYANRGYEPAAPPPANGSGGAGAPTRAHRSLMLQPWLGLVGSFGHPSFLSHRRVCYPDYSWDKVPEAHKKAPEAFLNRRALRGRAACGPSEPGAPLSSEWIVSPRAEAGAIAQHELELKREVSLTMDRLFNASSPPTTLRPGWVRGGGHETAQQRRRRHVSDRSLGRATNAYVVREASASLRRARLARRREESRYRGTAAASGAAGATPPSRQPGLEDLAEGRSEPPLPPRWFGDLSLLFNNTGVARTMAALRVPGGHRVSTTANLVRVRRVVWDAAAGRNRSCEAFLGVGHTHRAEGLMNRMYARDADFSGLSSKPAAPKARARRRLAASKGRRGRRPRAPFRFGFQYTHFWYTLQPAPPFRMLATSGEFCLAAEQDAADCESVQFISGLLLAEPDDAAGSAQGPRSLMLAYGVNDCEAKLGALPLDTVWQMLQPLPRDRRRERDASTSCELV